MSKLITDVLRTWIHIFIGMGIGGMVFTLVGVVWMDYVRRMDIRDETAEREHKEKAGRK